MTRLRSVVVLNCSAFLLMLGVGMIVALLPQRIITLSGSVSDVGYLASAFALTFVLFQIPIGSFSDKFGFKPFLVGGYFVCSVAGLFYYFSPSPNLIFFGRMLQGVGEVPIWALVPAFLSTQYPEEKGKFIGIYNASIHCGLMTGSFLGILIYRIWQGNEAFLLFAGLSFLGGLMIVLFVKVQRKESISSISTMNPRKVICLMSNLTNRTVFIGVILYGAGYGIFISIIPAFLFNIKEADQTVVGLFFVLFYIALGLSQLIAGHLSDKKGRKTLMIVGLIMAAVGISLFSKFNLPVLIGFLTLAAFGLGAFCVSAMAFLNDCVSNSLKGTISGAFYFSWGIGYFSAPLILGEIGQSGYWQLGFILFSGLFIIEIIACTIVLKADRKNLIKSAYTFEKIIKR
jgi:MFS family permease